MPSRHDPRAALNGLVVGSHSQLPVSKLQVPNCAEHACAHAFREQSAPKYPASHVHVPVAVSQRPLPEHAVGHERSAHDAPKYGQSHAHVPVVASHVPWLEHDAYVVQAVHCRHCGPV